MNIVLARPNFLGFSNREPPLGYAYLAAALRERGQKVFIVDGHAENLDIKNLTERIIRHYPNIVGLYATTPQITESLEIAKRIKEWNKDVSIWFGGPHPTAMPEESLKSGYVDVVVRGEGEETVKELLKKPLQKVDGISFRRKNKIIHNKDRTFIKDLDSLAFPDWDGFPIEFYKNPTKDNHPYLPIMATRGCPYKCTFCFRAVFGNVYRTRSPKNVTDELEYLEKKYKIKEFSLIDDNFTLNERYALSVCDEIIKRKINLPWSCGGGIRVDAAAPKLIKKMKEAGCYYLSFGVESGSQKILDKIQKRITLDQVRMAVKTAKENKIKTTCFVLIGLPGDTQESIKETIDFIKELDPDLALIGIVVPCPSTPLYENLERENKLLYREWDKYVRYSPRALFETTMTAKEIEKAYKDAIMSFYFRPGFLLKKFIHSPSDFFMLAKSFFKYNNFLEYLFRK